jgi:hypothetical protein
MHYINIGNVMYIYHYTCMLFEYVIIYFVYIVYGEVLTKPGKVGDSNFQFCFQNFLVPPGQSSKWTYTCYLPNPIFLWSRVTSVTPWKEKSVQKKLSQQLLNVI